MAHRVDPSCLGDLQFQQEKIRNFCILAHVDHGKTTLSDSLVSSNGIISNKLAGKLRFLDSTLEEQTRGITMHSSAISLLYELEDKTDTTAIGSNGKVDRYLINLIDSPGHIDFAGDVSTATRLCDGALIVVDVLEGVCTQTHAVLYKALRERMKPCLVLNKLDRLAMELRLSPVEAFYHLRRLLENINAVVYSLLNSELIRRAEEEAEFINAGKPEVPKNTPDSGAYDHSDSELFNEWNFSPENGNVIFTAAVDCWGFSLMKFVNIWSKKLGLNKAVLKKYFFEDYSFNSTTKKIVSCDPADATAKPMFATMVLDPIWQLYDVALGQQDPVKASKMAQRAFSVDVPAREVNVKDCRSSLQGILRRCMPLSDAILRIIVKNLPNPIQAQKDRLAVLLPRHYLQDSLTQSALLTSVAPPIPNVGDNEESFPFPAESEMFMKRKINEAVSAISSCTPSNNVPVTVFVSKMTPVKVAELSPADRTIYQELVAKKRLAQEESEESYEPIDSDPFTQEVFMALARVYSGVLTRNTQLLVLSHHHDPQTVTDAVDSNSKDIPSSLHGSITVVPPNSTGLYIMLGPSIFPADSVPAGNIVGIIGLEDYVLKTATLSTSWACPPLRAITFQSKPMVKVAIEPISHRDLKKLELGLQNLYHFDPVVEIAVDEATGQHLMVCLGELHLEQCVQALKDKFAKCELKVSEPLVSFREGITNSTASDNFTATSQTPRLPPPWSELLDSKWHTLVPIDASKIAGAKARLVMNSENLSLTFRCFPLPSTLISLLEREMDSAEKINAQVEKHFRDDEAAGNHDSSRNQKDSFTLLLNFWKEYNTATGTALENSELVDPILCATNEKVDRVMNFVCSGPRGVNTNVLHVSPDFAIEIFTAKVPPNQIAHTESTPVGNSSTILGNATAPDVQEEESAAAVAELLYEPVQFKDRPDIVKKVWDRVRSSVIAGFNEATAAGPLMHEPLHGVGVVLEKVELNYSLADTILTFEDYSSMSLRSDCSQADKLQRFKGSSSNSFVSGQLISEVSDTIQLAMLGCPLRLIEPIYQCDLQCDQQQLGNLYSVLAKRRGEVVKEDIIEGTSLFLLTAHLPVANSFGFAQELLKKTSGSGTAPQLHFSHWQTIDQDPFWRPTTEDEKEEFGDTTGTVVEKNLPRNFIDNVRKRKGLQIEEKIVVFAEKQRTLNKKK